MPHINWLAAAGREPQKTKTLRRGAILPQGLGGWRLPPVESSATLTTGRFSSYQHPFTQGICLPTMPYHTSGYSSIPPPSRIRDCPPATDCLKDCLSLLFWSYLHFSTDSLSFTSILYHKTVHLSSLFCNFFNFFSWILSLIVGITPQRIHWRVKPTTTKPINTAQNIKIIFIINTSFLI